MNFLQNQTHKYFTYNFSNFNELKIISVDKNLRPHLKYFLAMTFYRDYAIITLYDDIGYAKNTFETLFNSYIENPNIISGRRAHLMIYDNNEKLKSYIRWKFEQKNILSPDFNITLTTFKNFYFEYLFAKSFSPFISFPFILYVFILYYLIYFVSLIIIANVILSYHAISFSSIISSMYSVLIEKKMFFLLQIKFLLFHIFLFYRTKS